MIKHKIISMLGLNSEQVELLPYLVFAAILMFIIGYWTKKMIGGIIAVILVLFAYLYFTNTLNHIW